MKVNINGISVDHWEEGYPYWFHISDGNNEISFTHRDAYLIGKTLCILAKRCRGLVTIDKAKDEFGI